MFFCFHRTNQACRKEKTQQIQTDGKAGLWPQELLLQQFLRHTDLRTDLIEVDALVKLFVGKHFWQIRNSGGNAKCLDTIKEKGKLK